MEHTLINTVVISIVAAFVCGLIAKQLKFSSILGYLVAGILVGPFTPGFVADISVAQQLAEIGIILLMFGAGLHFSISDLMKVKAVSLPGAFFQMGVATVIGGVALWAMGHDWITGLVFGFSLSVASTVVLLRALEHRGALETPAGKISIGWLIVEDMAMVLALVLLPVVADLMTSGDDVHPGVFLRETVIVLIKIGAFMALMLVVGRKALPWLLVRIAKTKSHEMMILGTLAIALGFAFIAYSVFDASFALGAFFAGLVLNESEIGRKAAEKSLPLRDAFAVLFFVSVGMLFNPMTLIESPVMVVITLLIIVVGKAGAAFIITSLFKQDKETGYTVAISLAQIGEFSFILAGLAMARSMITEDVYNLILAGALLSIALNPFLFRWLNKRYPMETPATA